MVQPPALPLVAGLIGLALAVFIIAQVVRLPRGRREPIDHALAACGATWLLHLAAMTALVWLDAPKQATRVVGGAGAQLLTLCVAWLLVLSAHLGGPRILMLLALHALAGTATLVLFLDPPQRLAPGTALALWVGANLAGLLLLFIAIVVAARRAPSLARWLALAGCVLAMAFWIDGLQSSVPPPLPASFMQVFYAVHLLMTWHFARRQHAGRALETNSGFSNSGFETLTGFDSGGDATANAVANERRRIAQDLHDNLGSSIVNILAQLDSRGSHVHAPVALALEQLLLDLKLTVDAIDSANDTVPEALGRLRHRFQRSLDVMGIRMHWKVQLGEELDAARGPIAAQVLRIAQECLANVVQHSRATSVEVGCRFDPAICAIVLEVRDNGCGIDRKLNPLESGKGLVAMRRRAAAAGGTLLISSKLGAGTRVRLTVPFDPPPAPAR